MESSGFAIMKSLKEHKMDKNQYENVRWIDSTINEKIQKFEYFLGRLETQRLLNTTPKEEAFNDMTIFHIFEGYLMAYRELGCIDEDKLYFYISELHEKIDMLRKQAPGSQKTDFE